MYRIKLYNKIAKIGLSRLPAENYEIGEEMENADAILVRSAALHDVTFDKSLRAIARAGAGVNNIPIDRCTEEGICVFNTPGANANAVKELAVCALLLASRNVVGAIDWAKGLEGNEDAPAAVEKGKSAFVGPEIMGKTLGIVGFGGAIGKKVAVAANALGMSVVGYDPFASDAVVAELGDTVRRVTELSDLYEASDYISLHVPATPDTKGMINADAIAKMRDGVRILNLSRAALVDDSAILPALEEGKVAVYVTDFPNGEVIGKKGVVAIPHLGASTPESEDNCAVMAVDEVRDYLECGNVRNSVNLPNLVKECAGEWRITVIHEEGFDAVEAIKSLGITVNDAQTAFRKGIAYTIADTDADASAALTLGENTAVKRVVVL
ncbi:MAG: 3-phosphoglycerate dehydrogenase [Clostridia bacterium]|nr:3-phosphoglycerate dehydrogenase [Clostridia bacterium]